MSRTNPEDLLATWAHRPGDLTADERRGVEELIARSPEAARQAEEARAMIGRVTELPAEGHEPVWGDLERSIRLACDEPPPGRWARWLDVLRGGRPAAAVGAGLVVAMAALALWIVRTPDRDLGSGNQTVELALASLEAAGPTEAAAAGGADEPDALDVDGDPLDDGSEAVLAEWGAVAPSDALLDDEDLAWDLAWLDDLDDDELDAVAMWLDSQEPG